VAAAGLAVFATAARADSYLDRAERPLAADRASVAPAATSLDDAARSVSAARGPAAPAGPAAATYLDEAADGLDEQRGWVSPEVKDSIDLVKVLSVDPSGRVAVAVLPENAVLESSATAMAVDLYLDTDWPAVVVAVGSDLSAYAAILEQKTSLEVANQAEKAGAGLEGNLTEAVRGIAQALEEAAPSGENPGEGDQAASSAAADDQGDSFWDVVRKILLGLLLAPLVVLVGLALLIAWLVRRRRRRGIGTVAKVSKATPGDVADHLERLRELRGRYLAWHGGGYQAQAAKAMAQAIARIIADTSELFRRIAAKGGGDQMAVAQVEYRDQLAKVAEVLGQDYYLDILARPDLWDDPAGRAKAVDEAVAAFVDQIIDNIKQVNAAQDLRFQVSLDSLARAKRDQSPGLYHAPDERQEQ
jgi:hypothetical protein